MESKEYKLNIDPRILELLGPSLYTNVYYVLAELVANAYDADAQNVFIIANKDDITVEDDGKGMSYEGGEIRQYLDVAAVSRRTEEESVTQKSRRKMGRKGVGKLAALSVSENVLIKTITRSGEKSGFVLSRLVEEGNFLKPIPENEINFSKITGHGTAVIMQNPQYRLNSTIKAIKRNLLKIFPLISSDFRIHIIRGSEKDIIDDFDKEMISELSTIILLGDEFHCLREHFCTPYPNHLNALMKLLPKATRPVTMKDKSGDEHSYNVEVQGWIGTYLTTKGRKVAMTDFPDNFISLYANKKMGEFNILPIVGHNKLYEVYVVGQLHVDIFELTELPDMALSNRQGYKSEDPRYQKVLEYVSNELLPEILRMRDWFVSLGKKNKVEKKLEEQRANEAALRRSMDTFRNNTSKKASERIAKQLGTINPDQESQIQTILREEINSNSPDMGIKSIVDSQKKRILISQTYSDKDLADVIYSMLIYNNVPQTDIIYTNCDDETSRIPEGDVGQSGVYNYLRDFFVDSYSTQKMYVIFVTSHATKQSWGALTEVGAAWITQVEHKIFNVRDFRPEHPLDDESLWHTSFRDTATLCMSRLSVDIFAQKIEYICDKLGYSKRTRAENKARLCTLIRETER